METHVGLTLKDLLTIGSVICSSAALGYWFNTQFSAVLQRLTAMEIKLGTVERDLQNHDKGREKLLNEFRKLESKQHDATVERANLAGRIESLSTTPST